MAQFPWYAEYRPGKLGGKPDALTRRSGDLPKEGDERLAQRSQTLLKLEDYTPIQIASLATPKARLDTLCDSAYAADTLLHEILELLRTGASRCTTLSI